VYQALFDSAAKLHIPLQDFGQYAMESMRLEKGYRAVQHELDHETSPLMAGLNRFIKLEKNAPFPGKEALLAELDEGSELSYVQLLLDDHQYDAMYGCTIVSNDDMVGYTTSGGYGFRLRKGIALGYVTSSLARPGTKLQVRIFDETVQAEVVAEPAFDPNNDKLRA